MSDICCDDCGKVLRRSGHKFGEAHIIESDGNGEEHICMDCFLHRLPPPPEDELELQ
jgi:hypothetical protein